MSKTKNKNKPELPGADALFGSTPIHVDKHTSKHVNKYTCKTKTEELQKYSLYFTSDILEKLDDVWFQLRRKNQKIAKWRIVNLILEKHLSVEHIEELLKPP